MLDEVAGQAPGPEREVAVADGLEAEAAELENENVGAEKIVAPILEEGRDAAKVLLPATMIERSRRTDEHSASRLEHAPTPRQPSVYVLAVADGFERVDGVETIVREIEAVEVGHDHADAPAELLEFSPADLRLHGGIGDACDLDLALAGNVISRRARSAPELQQAHPIRRREQGEVGFVGMRERRPRKDAGAVIVELAAVGTEYVVIGAILVVVLKKIVGLGHPFHELPLFEFVQHMADAAGVLRVRGEKKKGVMKQVIGHERAGDDRQRPEKHRNSIHALLP